MLNKAKPVPFVKNWFEKATLITLEMTNYFFQPFLLSEKFHTHLK